MFAAFISHPSQKFSLGNQDCDSMEGKKTQCLLVACIQAPEDGRSRSKMLRPKK